MKIREFVLIAAAATILSGCQTIGSTWDAVFGLEDPAALNDEASSSASGPEEDVIWVLGDR